ncbi:MAG: hypothetical protein N3A54_06740 [Patescibacteria group bacterium]|nr:hypothetical protein [Patescibacteria group bacterium]
MSDIVFVLGWFIAAFFLHAFLHRIFIRFKRLVFFFVGLYFLGIPLLILKHVFAFQSGQHLLLTASCISLIMALLMTVLYVLRFLEGQTPTSVILSAFQKTSILREEEIFRLFSDRDLVDVRLKTLQRHGYVVYKNGKWRVSIKGRITFIFLACVMILTGMEVGG